MTARPFPPGPGFGSPQLLQVVFEQIGGQQGFVGGQQLLELDAPLSREVVPIAQQERARGLHYTSRRVVGAQMVGIVHPQPINDFAPVLGHHVDEVVDHFSVGALGFDVDIKGRIHVRRHGLDAYTTDPAE